MNLRKALNSFDGSLRGLARSAKVSHATLISIRDGKNLNPGYLTVQRIEKALLDIEAETKPAPKRRRSTAPSAQVVAS